MQTQKRQTRTSGRGVKGRQRQLLLVSSGRRIETNDAFAALARHQLHATSLLEALGRLEPERIDLVLLGSEFREEERTLFLLEAQRRGFNRPVLHVVSAEVPFSRSHRQHELGTENRRQDLDSVSFTEREQAVLQRVSGGWTNRQIAQDLKCSEGSVKTILQQIFNKLGVRKRAQIVRLVFEHGFPVASIGAYRSPRRYESK